MSTSELFDQVKIGWRALGEIPEGKELQSISVISNKSIKIRAGRLVEGNSEVVLFRFELDHFPKTASLPKGNGFDVRFFRIAAEDYIGINRTAEGALDLFEAMLVDVLSHVMRDDRLPHRVLFKRFMDRVQAWQAFMGRGKKGLSRKNQLGLIGELLILRDLLSFNLPTEDVLEWWRGPLHGIHDFQILGSAIEVKTSTAEHGFEIEVFDLEQLEPSGVHTLYLSAVRLKLSNSGETLPQIIDSIKASLKNNPSASSLFEIALNYSGYHRDHDSYYTLATSLVDVMYFEVTDDFPSLRRKKIPIEVTKVRYSLELDFLQRPQKTLEDTLIEIGVLTHGTE